MAALTFNFDSVNKRVLNISALNTADEDWEWTDHFPAEMGLHSIQFRPGSDGTDICVLKIVDDTGPEVFYVKCADVADQRPLEYSGDLFNLYLDVDAGTYSAGAMLIIIATDRKMGPRH